MYFKKIIIIIFFFIDSNFLTFISIYRIVTVKITTVLVTLTNKY